MITLLFAVGSLLIVMVAILFLPLGLTKKGKLMIVMISFFMAMIGVASTVSFPLWESILMLTALLFFAAYFLNSRGKSFLYLTGEYEMLKERMLTLEEQEFSADKESFFETFKLSNDEIAISENENNYIGFLYEPSEPKIFKSEIMEDIPELVEDDTSFLLNRNMETNEEKVIANDKDDLSYLLDIEGLLEDMDEGSE